MRPLDKFDIAFSVCVIVAIVTSLAIVWGLYSGDKHWQQNAESGDCYPVNYTAVRTTCGTPKQTHACYNGYMFTEVQVDNINYYCNVLITNDATAELVIQDMQDEYPLGKKFDCWYNTDDPNDIHIGDFATGVYGWMSIAVVIIILLVAGMTYPIFRKTRR